MHLISGGGVDDGFGLTGAGFGFWGAFLTGAGFGLGGAFFTGAGAGCGAGRALGRGRFVAVPVVPRGGVTLVGFTLGRDDVVGAGEVVDVTGAVVDVVVVDGVVMGDDVVVVEADSGDVVEVDVGAGPHAAMASAANVTTANKRGERCRIRAVPSERAMGVSHDGARRRAGCHQRGHTMPTPVHAPSPRRKPLSSDPSPRTVPAITATTRPPTKEESMPTRQPYTAHDRGSLDDLRSALRRGDDVADAVRAGELERDDLDLALDNGNAAVRLAAAQTQQLTWSQVDRFLDGDTTERVAAATHQQLLARQVDTLVTDPDAQVRVAVATHQTLSEDHVSRMLHDSDTAVRKAVIERHEITREQARAVILDGDADLIRAVSMHQRHDVVDLTADIDNEVAAVQTPAETATSVAPVKVRVTPDAGSDVPATHTRAASSEDRAWQAAAEREYDREADSVIGAFQRTEAWGFDTAWDEHNTLMAKIGTRPAGPERLVDVASASVEEARVQLEKLIKNSRRLGPGAAAGVLRPAMQDAQDRVAAADARLKELTDQVAAGTHPTQLEQAAWDAEHGADAARLVEVKAAMLEHCARRAEVGGVPPVPTGDIQQALYLRMHGGYEAVLAHVERTGRVNAEDVAALQESKVTLNVLSSRYSRGLSMAEEEASMEAAMRLRTPSMAL